MEKKRVWMGVVNVSCQLAPTQTLKKGVKTFWVQSVADRSQDQTTTTSRRDGFLRHFPLFYLRYDGAEMTGN